MSIKSRFIGWLRRITRQRTSVSSHGPLREFVYLDEISVCSILASRKGGIATEFTESQTASLNSEVGGSIGVGFGANKANLNSKMQAGHVHGSQVLRKAIIQTSFKELYDIERDALRLSLLGASDPPTVSTITDLEKRLDSPSTDRWLVDPRAIHRGKLLEAEVVLEADPIFRVSAIITTLCELIESNDHLFDRVITTQLAEMRSIAQVLESLLAGLVPIRGRLVDYKAAIIGGRDVLVHRSLLDQIPADVQLEAYPAFVVGVAQSDLFWKDIRRVLFSEARYTVFCRLATSGLTDRWQPVKVADVLAGIVPAFDELIREFSENARRSMTAPVDASPAALGQDTRPGMQVIRKYAALLADHHCGVLKLEFVDDLILGISLEEGWQGSIDTQRSVFAAVTRRVDAALRVETSAKIAYELRCAARGNSGFDRRLGPQGSRGVDRDPASVARPERFLDAEIVAIYW